MVKANHALSNSALVGSRELQSCTVYNHLPPPGVQCITQNKIPIKRFWIQAIKQYQTQLFWAWCLNKIKTHQIILKKKKSNVKTESPLGKQKAREIWQALDSEGKCLLFRPIKEQRVKSRWFQLADLKTFSLVNKCTDIFTENIYFRINSEMEIWKEARPFITLTTFPPDQ